VNGISGVITSADPPKSLGRLLLDQADSLKTASDEEIKSLRIAVENYLAEHKTQRKERRSSLNLPTSQVLNKGDSGDAGGSSSGNSSRGIDGYQVDHKSNDDGKEGPARVVKKSTLASMVNGSTKRRAKSADVSQRNKHRGKFFYYLQQFPFNLLMMMIMMKLCV
jgi:hypothetical protein